jgi:predicted phosphate transport protein (TIGR00153 family)
MKFLLPKEPAFYQHFKEMSACLTDITVIFQDFSRDFRNSESHWHKAKDVEHQADSIAHRIINLLNQSFITPFDREDIYRLIHDLDEIVDLIENTIHNVFIYNVSEKKDFVDEFAPLIKDATVSLNELIKECFEYQKYTDSIWKLICVIHDLEDKGDLAYEKALRRLFVEERDPVQIIKWKDILATLEFIMDAYQRVSNTVEGMVVKNG